jgi:hypothetical protein
MAAQARAASAPGGSVLTFVIGVGQFPSSNAQSFDPAFLGNLALAGGGAPAACNANETQSNANLCYFEIDPTQSTGPGQLQQQFTQALETIRGQVLTCSFALQTTGLGTIDPSRVNVQVDGQTVPQGAADGWTYDDPQAPTAIVLHGQACDSVKSDPKADVSIVVGCATQVK